LTHLKLLIATHNPGKLREYRGLLGIIPYELVSLDHLGITEEVEETGRTFHENARLKASTYAALSGLLTLADDSGLEVDALGGEPGVHSARYGGGSYPSDQDRVSLLLRNLEGVPWARRTARFRCVIAITTPSEALKLSGGMDELTQVVGSVAGMIQYEAMGEEGFGYDPVFYLPSYGLTIAQLPLEEKNRISHRANAAGKAMRVLKQLHSGHHSAINHETMTDS
jgi:XTP/dITP diphosphohydrolase